jgi:hypothetical protein
LRHAEQLAGSTISSISVWRVFASRARDEASPVRDLRVPSRLQFDTDRHERLSRLRRLSTL